MQMLERYLHAIAFWLPNDRQDDLIAEISEDLHAKIEDEQAKLGRKLTDAELEALLKRRGRPVLVASGYRQQQSLIGPVWFPAYVFVLKIIALCYVLPWVVVFVIVHRVQHPGFHWGTTFLAAWGTAWTELCGRGCGHADLRPSRTCEDANAFSGEVESAPAASGAGPVQDPAVHLRHRPGRQFRVPLLVGGVRGVAGPL